MKYILTQVHTKSGILLLNLEHTIKSFLHLHSGKFPVWNLPETQMLLQIEFEVLIYAH